MGRQTNFVLKTTQEDIDNILPENRELIDDFIKINNSIKCDSKYCSCYNCSKKQFCEFIGNLINSMRKYYNEV